MNSLNQAHPTWIPELIAAHIDEAKDNAAVAIQVGTLMTIDTTKVKIPTVVSDPVAAFGAEGSILNESDAGLGGIIVEPARVGVVSKVTREFYDDQGQIAPSVLNGQGRDIARRIDAALFAETPATPDDPEGLGAVLDDVTQVEAGGSWANVDPFTEASGNAEACGAVLDSWVCNSTTAKSLGTLKTGTGSNLPLLGSDPTQPGRRQILGSPLYVSDYIPAGVVWGLPKEHLAIVQRGTVESTVDESVYFKEFAIGLRSVARVGFGITYAEAFQRIALDSALLSGS